MRGRQPTIRTTTPQPNGPLLTAHWSLHAAAALSPLSLSPTCVVALVGRATGRPYHDQTGPSGAALQDPTLAPAMGTILDLAHQSRQISDTHSIEISPTMTASNAWRYLSRRAATRAGSLSFRKPTRQTRCMPMPFAMVASPKESPSSKADERSPTIEVHSSAPSRSLIVAPSSA